MTNLKKSIRERLLKLRESMDNEQVKEKSRRITEFVLGFESFRDSNTVMCYMDFRNEVKTRDIIKYCISSGKKIAVPVIDKCIKTGRRGIVPYVINDVENGMEIGTFGILEPKKDAEKRINPEEIDFVLVPGVAFDKKGNRIGFGAGYYDRFLSKVRKDCIKAGLAFHSQILDNIPAEEHDICMDFIISDKGILRIQRT